MLRVIIPIVFLLRLASPAVADDPLPLPKQVPPLVATAVATDSGSAGEASEWRIKLTLPKTTWSVVGQVVPKTEWPRLQTEVEKVSVELQLGGPSQLAESRIVDIEGNDLNRDQVLKRLAQERPVLVSVSGEMPDRYYLQLTKEDALIIILGPRDGAPAPGFLPAPKKE